MLEEMYYLDLVCGKSDLVAHIPASWSREEQLAFAQSVSFFFRRDWARSVRGAGAGGVFKMLRVLLLSLRRGARDTRSLLSRAEWFAMARVEDERVFAAAPRLFRTPARDVLYQALRACYRQLRRMAFPSQGYC